LPTTFLVLSLVGALLTLNAFFPRSRRSIFAVPSFFAAWPTTELSPQFLFVQVLGAAGLVWLGGLDDAAGFVALGIAIASWTGLAVVARRAWGSWTFVEEALVEGLGSNYTAALGDVADATAKRALPVIRLALAVPIADRTIEAVRDLRYAAGAGRRHQLDLYRAADDPPKDAPVLLQIHGGAWIVGNKREQARPLINHLAAHGWVCVAPNYRLSPKATFPDHLLDVKLALRWVREHVADYGGDPDFVVVTGGSAGGHLATLAACTANDPEYQPGFETLDTSVAACVPFYGAYDLCGRFAGRGADGMGGLVERMVLKRRLADDPVAFSRASPLDRIHPDLPPFFVVHGSDDSLVPIAEARAFAARLRAQSASPVVFLELPGTQHAFEIFHSVRCETVVRGAHRFLSAVHQSWCDKRAS
jgi:acetyl esterase/lipase